MRKAIVGGSILVDRINDINVYPKPGELARISAVSRTPGGLVPNTGTDIHVLAPDIPVFACGKIGEDDDGRYLIGELQRRGLDTSGLAVTADEPTSFTDVMSVPGGERTFFNCPGANASWGYDDFPFDLVSEGDIVLLGYFLLLAKVDAGDGVRMLRELKRRGAITAIDLVTEDSDRYALVRECLPYVDHLIVNETEAARLAGGDLPVSELPSALLRFGVRERVIVHMPEKGISCTKAGIRSEFPSCPVPPSFIKGKTGAGDAFCAGALVGIWRGLDEREILRLGAIAAIGALSAPGATEGMRSIEELAHIAEKLSNRE
ncbi:MAG: carbohydrate kinase family protein [Kiritimatiellae bacterium]|nr:carbohydrate kinase family protein [Kiritimatiellia bacterium]